MLMAGSFASVNGITRLGNEGSIHLSYGGTVLIRILGDRTRARLKRGERPTRPGLGCPDLFPQAPLGHDRIPH